MLFENLKEALSNILCNKMRSILTMLGIIIGISAVITITTIGNSIQKTLTSTFNSLGGNALTVYVEPEYPEDDTDWDTWEYPVMDKEDYITDAMIDELKETYPDEVKGISATNYLGSAVITKNSDVYANVEIQGVTPDYLSYAKLKMYYGRCLTEEDDKKHKKVCIISDTMAKSYFDTQNPVGEQLECVCADGNTYKFVVVGIYEYNPAMFGKVDTSIPERDRSTAMFIPHSTSYSVSNNTLEGYDYLDIILNPQCDVDIACSDVTAFFDEKYADNEDWNTTIYNMASDLGMMNTVINIVTIAISAIAAISLIVGGVGVMNIMLVSITERTREIGVRMALGAKRKTIRLQFIVEAITLCLIGGLIGVTIGIVNGYLLGQVAELFIQSAYEEYAGYIILSVKPSMLAIEISLFFSMLTGVFFGFYPANKASKMEVIDALRYE